MADTKQRSRPLDAPLQHQLVLEIYVSCPKSSMSFYKSLGFAVDWYVPNIFAQVSWEHSILFLKPKDNLPMNASTTKEHRASNIRIMVSNVDLKYEECKQLGCVIEQELGDRKFILRDFIVKDPDGFGVRFGSYLPGSGPEERAEGPHAAGIVSKGTVIEVI